MGLAPLPEVTHPIHVSSQRRRCASPLLDLHDICSSQLPGAVGQSHIVGYGANSQIA